MLRDLERTTKRGTRKVSPVYPVSSERPGRVLVSRTLPKRGKLTANHDRQTFEFRLFVLKETVSCF